MDGDNDGIQNSSADDIPYEDVVVNLYDQNGVFIASTTTDATGAYLFTGLNNGTYQVEFINPDSTLFIPTVANTSDGDDTTDSDITSASNRVTAVINDADNLTIDAGYTLIPETPQPVPATYELGDYVWIDSTKDGIQNSDETPVAGVTVTLTRPDGTTATTTTDATGKYVFTDLPNGDYTVTFTLPEGYTATATNIGDPALDSNGLTSTVTINNADNYTVDLGVVAPVVPEPTPVPATYELGDYVWIDSTKDGIQNSDETPVAGVTVTLTRPDGTTATTTTDATGKYVFTDLPNGDYTVTFTLPEGYTATATNIGDPALDSNGLTSTVTINNADNYTVDLGVVAPVVPEPTPVPATYTIGDKVFEDTNKDGIQNSNEPGIPNVPVTLTKPDGTTVTTTTDANGNYEFTNLPNGEYTVEFGTPEGYTPTATNVGDDRLDSDGQKVTVVVNNGDDLTIDSGFYKPTPAEP
ncbi:Cna B-type domain-containing protein, partial [Macrococcus brunensis]